MCGGFNKLKTLFALLRIFGFLNNCFLIAFFRLKIIKYEKSKGFNRTTSMCERSLIRLVNYFHHLN